MLLSPLQLATSKNTSLLLFPRLLRVATPLETWSHRLLPPLKTAMHRTTWTPSTRDVAQEIRGSVLLSALHPTSSSQQGGKWKWNSYVLCSLAIICLQLSPLLILVEYEARSLLPAAFAHIQSLRTRLDPSVGDWYCNTSLVSVTMPG